MATSFQWNEIQDQAKRLSFINPKTTLKIGKRYAWYSSDDFEDQVWAPLVKPKLFNVFNKNRDEIFGRGRRSFCAIKCYMTSTSPDWKQAKPTVVVSSTRPKYSRKTIAILVKSPIILRLDCGFDFYADPRVDDTTTCSGPGVLGPPDFDIGPHRLCGARILVAPLPESSSSQLRHATLGGIIQIDDNSYGLTVAHAFSGPADVPSDSTDDSHSESSDSVISSSVNRSSTESLTNIPHSQTGTVYLDPAFYRRTIDHRGSCVVVPDGDSPELLPDHVLGELHEYDSRSPGLNRSNDWALIKITDPRFCKPNTFRLGERVIQCTDVATETPRGEIAVLAGFSGVALRQSHGRTAGILLQGAQEMVSAWTIEGSSCDCGSLVVDSTSGSIYGMLVASSGRQRNSYCLPMSDIFDSILSTVGTRPTVYKGKDGQSERNKSPIKEITSTAEQVPPETVSTRSQPDDAASSGKSPAADSVPAPSHSLSSQGVLSSTSAVEDPFRGSNLNGTKLYRTIGDSQQREATIATGTFTAQRDAPKDGKEDDKPNTNLAKSKTRRRRKKVPQVASGSNDKSFWQASDSDKHKGGVARESSQAAAAHSSILARTAVLDENLLESDEWQSTQESLLNSKAPDTGDGQLPRVTNRGPSCYEVTTTDLDKTLIRSLGYSLWVGDTSSIVETYGNELKVGRLLNPRHQSHPVTHAATIASDTEPDLDAETVPESSKKPSGDIPALENTTTTIEQREEDEVQRGGSIQHLTRLKSSDVRTSLSFGQSAMAHRELQPQRDDSVVDEIVIRREPNVSHGKSAVTGMPARPYQKPHPHRSSMSSAHSSVDSGYGTNLNARRDYPNEVINSGRFEETVFDSPYDEVKIGNTALVSLKDKTRQSSQGTYRQRLPDPGSEAAHRLSSYVATGSTARDDTLAEEIVIGRRRTENDPKSHQVSTDVIEYVWDQNTNELIPRDRFGADAAAGDLRRIQYNRAHTKERDKHSGIQIRRQALQIEDAKSTGAILAEEEELLNKARRVRSRKSVGVSGQQPLGSAHPLKHDHRFTVRPDFQDPRYSAIDAAQIETEPARDLDGDGLRDNLNAKDIQEERDHYKRIAMRRARPKEACDGATLDWSLVDVPPGTARLMLRGGRSEGSPWWKNYIKDPNVPPSYFINPHRDGVSNHFETEVSYPEATPDWRTIDVPPGTSEVFLEGLGGAVQIITWQRYNGVRMARFYADGVTPARESGNQGNPPTQTSEREPQAELDSDDPGIHRILSKQHWATKTDGRRNPAVHSDPEIPQRTAQDQPSRQPGRNSKLYPEGYARLVRDYRVNALTRGLSTQEIEDILAMIELGDKESRLASLSKLLGQVPRTESVPRKEVVFSTVPNSRHDTGERFNSQGPIDNDGYYRDDRDDSDNQRPFPSRERNRKVTLREAQKHGLRRDTPAFLQDDYGRAEDEVSVIRAPERENLASNHPRRPPEGRVVRERITMRPRQLDDSHDEQRTAHQRARFYEPEVESRHPSPRPRSRERTRDLRHVTVCFPDEEDDDAGARNRASSPQIFDRWGHPVAKSRQSRNDERVSFGILPCSGNLA